MQKTASNAALYGSGILCVLAVIIADKHLSCVQQAGVDLLSDRSSACLGS